jgi:hypothetical protein
MMNKKMTIGILAVFTLVCLALSINASAGPSNKADFPHEVWKAMQNGHDQVEMHVSKELSQIHFIDYASHATSTGNDCGPESSSYKLMRVKWKAFPITYSIDASAISQDVNGDSIVDNNDVLAAQQAVQNSINTWEAEEHPAGSIFVQSANANVPIKWAYIDGAGGTLAVTSVTYYTASKAIVRAPVTFDSGDLWKVYSQLSCTGQGNSFDIENVGTHELGHVLGLDHARRTMDSALTMWPYASQGETLKRTLGTGDKKGLDALY